MNIKNLVFVFILLFGVNVTKSQDTTTKQNLFKVVFRDTIDTDITDIIKQIFKSNRNKIPATKNFQYAVLPAIGYSLQTGFALVVSGNAGFSMNRKDSNQKLSTISSGITYSQQNQIIFPFVLNLWTKNNKFNIISDNRFLNYPDYIFGIGNKSNSTIQYRCEFSALRLHESILTKVANNTSIGLGFFFDKFWNISGFDTIKTQLFNNVNSVKKEIASGVGVRFLYDNRLNQINPNKGFFSNIIFRRNYTFLGSNTNWAYLTTDTRAYIPFPKKSKNVLAIWNYNWLSLGNEITNFLIPSNGWDDLHNVGRGYIQGRFRGKNMFSFETEYRFALTKNGFLGATIFGNAMHFNQEYFFINNAIKFGGGVGLRIKFNKHSKSNLCIDYAWGQNGSRGFFVNIGEVF